MTNEAKTKQAFLLERLEQGKLMMHIDARHPQVKVPPYLKDDVHLRLNLSYLFDIPDLEITETEVIATLSFQQSPFPCRIPLEAIWGISQPPGMNLQLFPEDLPPEVLFQLMLEQMPTQEEAPRSAPAPRSRAPGPVLSVLPDPDDEETSQQQETETKQETGPTPPPTDRPKKQRPSLRLVTNNPDLPSPTTPTPSPAERPHLRVVKNLSNEED